MSSLSSQYQATQYQARCTQFRRRNGFDGKDFVFDHISARILNLDATKVSSVYKIIRKRQQESERSKKGY